MEKKESWKAEGIKGAFSPKTYSYLSLEKEESWKAEGINLSLEKEVRKVAG